MIAELERSDFNRGVINSMDGMIYMGHALKLEETPRTSAAAVATSTILASHASAPMSPDFLAVLLSRVPVEVDALLVNWVNLHSARGMGKLSKNRRTPRSLCPQQVHIVLPCFLFCRS